MRYIIRNNHDYDGITECIIDEMHRQLDIDGGIVFDYGDPNRKRQKDVVYKESVLCWRHDNFEMEGIYDPIDREILDAMLKYKSMAMDIMMRECGYNIYRHDYLENLYYKELHYWNSLLDQEKIDFILFMVSPHHIGEYILYALAQCKNIKTFLMEGIMIPGFFCISRSIENMGEVVESAFSQLRSSDKKIDLNVEFDTFYNKALEKRVFSPEEKKIDKKIAKNILSAFIRPANVGRRFLKIIAVLVFPRYSQNRKFEFSNAVRLFKLLVVAIFHNLLMDNAKEYKRYALQPDFKRPYIYFALQVTPEENTMPRAGEYKNQRLSVETLAKGAGEVGVQVYVKEHWTQYHREKGFYRALSEIPNVFLIDLEINSGELIENAMAVSTQTGTCMLEGMLHKKNVLYFGDGAVYKGIPGSFRIDSTEQLSSILKKIESGEVDFSQEDAVLYLKALQSVCIEGYIDSLEECPKSYDKLFSAKRIVSAIKQMW